MIKTVTEKNISPIIFIDKINDIIATNSVEKHNYSVSDRVYIAAILRAHSISKDFVRNSETVDLTALDKNNNKLPDSIFERTITSSELKIVCKVPTLAEDTTYNTALIELSKNKATTDVLGEIFIFEASKYISSIESSTLGLNIKLNDLPARQRCQLVETLPAKIYNEVIDYINQVRVEESKNFVINDKPVEIDLDQSFFTA